MNMTEENRERCRGKRNFTLIELLIVIAIIAILAGMLLPALNSAREKSRTANCIGNLKQIGVVFQSYANDWNDYITPGSYSTPDNNDMPWQRTYVKSGYLPASNWAGDISTKPGLVKGVYRCPTESFLGSVWGDWGASHYGMGFYFGSYTYGGYADPASVNYTWCFRKISQVNRNVSEVAAFGDKAPRSEFTVDYLYFAFPPPSPTAATYYNPLLRGLRHNNSMNVAMLDGHAVNMKLNNFPNPSNCATTDEAVKYSFWGRMDKQKNWKSWK